jgi:hypothetical protein
MDPLKIVIYAFPAFLIIAGFLLYSLDTFHFEIGGIRLLVSGVVVYLVEIIMTLIIRRS